MSTGTIISRLVQESQSNRSTESGKQSSHITELQVNKPKLLFYPTLTLFRLRGRHVSGTAGIQQLCLLQVCNMAFLHRPLALCPGVCLTLLSDSAITHISRQLHHVDSEGICSRTPRRHRKATKRQSHRIFHKFGTSIKLHRSVAPAVHFFVDLPIYRLLWYIFCCLGILFLPHHPGLAKTTFL